MPRLAMIPVVLACAAAVPAAHAGSPRMAVHAFELGDVRLLEGPFKAASERNAEYLLRLEPDRLLHNTLKYAGLEPKGELYGGWESTGIAGHTLGHYLTALAQQFAASGDARFRQRIDYTVAEMARAQEAYGDGYVGALPPLLYGPVVLAGDLGPVPRGETFPWAKDQAANFEAQPVPVPRLVSRPERAAAALERLPGTQLAFRADGVLEGRAGAVTLRPFPELHYRYYNVYWDFVPEPEPGDSAARAAPDL